MDNGEKEKAVAKGIKDIVKHTSRRKGRLGTTIGQFRDRNKSREPEPRMIGLAPKAANPEVVLQVSDGGQSINQTGLSPGDGASPENSIGSSTDRTRKSSPVSK